MTPLPPPEIENGVAPAHVRANKQATTDELTARSRGRRVAIRPAWSTVFDRGSRRNWFSCPRTPFGSPGLLTATPLRAGVARDCRVVAWCDLCRGISAQIQGRFCSLVRARVWGKGMAHWLGGERPVGANKQIQDCLFEVVTKGSCRRQR